MITPYVIGQFAYADRVLKKSAAASAGDAELESYLSSYLAVFLSGIYEDCIEHLLAQRAAKSGDPEVSAYVQKVLDETFRNPTFEKVLDVMKKFSQQYAAQLKAAVQARNAEAMNSIVNNKNLVAHGKRSQLTLGDVANFHSYTIPIFEALEKILC